MNVPVNQNPFSLYDFLGYLIPGIFFWALILYIDNMIFCSTITKHLHIEKLIPYDLTTNKIGEVSAVIWIAILVFLYLSGHVLALFNSS
jgi:hypothetical protein